MRIQNFRAEDEYEKEFVAIVDRLCYTRQRWQVWEDLIEAIACSISNTTEWMPERRERREKQFADAINRIGSMEPAAKAMACIVEALEVNPNRDFLGGLYMRLALGSHWHGQFFTPYSICRMTAEMQMGKIGDMLNKNGWISLCDPAIGGGAMLIAAANHMKTMGINYQSHAVFVGQDIDRVAGMMAYIQLSLLGCPGYICIADTLTNPLTGPLLTPDEREGQEFWYTPFFFTDIWLMRRKLKVMDAFLRTASHRKEKAACVNNAVKMDASDDHKAEPEKKEDPKPERKTGKRSGGMEGQLSLFDLIHQ